MIFSKCKNRIFLAPMAGVADAAFRQIAIEMGAGFTYTEMVSAKGLYYGSQKTSSLIQPAPNEEFFGVQFFSSDTEALRDSIQAVAGQFAGRVLLFDLNMGCPAPKITGNGEGSALMKDPARAETIIRAAVAASSVPVTCKFRAGWDEHSINAVEFGKMAQGAGAAAVAVHGRTRAQGYGGRSDNRIIASVKNALSIPVIGSGDIFTASEAIAMFSQTGCDAVMVARGARGNPFLFREILHLRQTGTPLPPASPAEKAAVLFRQASIAVQQKGEALAMRQIRKHAAWYLKGLPGAADARRAAVSLTTLADLAALLCRIVPGFSPPK